jgi:acetyltransferase-like isoleucine patch superfamily enzyme
LGKSQKKTILVMGLKEKINSNPALKKLVHWMLIPTGDAVPRLWVKLFVNPFVHKHGKGSKIKRARMDVLPFNKFELGEKSTIEDYCSINNGVGDVFIGDNTLIGMSNVVIGPVTIGNNVIFAKGVVLSGLNHEYRDITMPISLQKTIVSQIIVEDDCWIGANTVITAGVTIGKHCVVAAGAVVTKSIPPYSVAVGNPARVIKKYDFTTNEWVSVKN